VPLNTYNLDLLAILIASPLDQFGYDEDSTGLLGNALTNLLPDWGHLADLSDLSVTKKYLSIFFIYDGLACQNSFFMGVIALIDLNFFRISRAVSIYRQRFILFFFCLVMLILNSEEFVVVIELGLISSNNSYFVSRCLVIRL
jgi:hypothetical protein